MEDKKPSTTIEDYLGVIYTMERDGEQVIGARLAEALDVSRSNSNHYLEKNAT